MDLVVFLLVSAVVLGAAYRWLGARLAEWLALDRAAPVPAHVRRDGLDFEPARATILLPQHFSAIAAAGPIVGPILAGTLFGWAPAWLWIILGSILIGGVHDITTLVASVRHEGRSIAEVVRIHMNRRSYILFLIFIWIALIYVVIAFADVTAGAFVQAASAAQAVAPGPAVATSSLLYLLLAVAMGLCIRFLRLGTGWAKLIFIPLVFGAILVGPHVPIDLKPLAGDGAQRWWNYLLLVYCFAASIAPVWLLLQPRGELGGYFLYLIMIAGVVGIVVGGAGGALAIHSPAFTGAGLFTTDGTTPPLFPILFITVACGACSGFHSIVSSGTTSKQLNCEADARPVAYGSMLLEAFFACISLATVMILAEKPGKPDAVYAQGISTFVHHASFGLVPVTAVYQFALLCFATFVFDTLDACTRLARYVLMELTGWKGKRGILAATACTLALPVLIASLPPAEIAGKTEPIWRVFWNLFGSSNQLLAALALLAASVWLRRTGRRAGLALFGTLFMLGMSIWSLVYSVQKHLARMEAGPAATLHHVEFCVALLLISLSTWLAVEAGLVFFDRNSEKRVGA